MPSPLALGRKFPFYRNGLLHEKGYSRQSSWFPWTRPGLLLLWLLIGCVVYIWVSRRQPAGFSGDRPAYIACGAVEDTFRSLAVLPATKKIVKVGTTNYIVDSGDSERRGSDGEPIKDSRPKVLAFIGIQTGFGSAERRKALRQTWFPPTASDLIRMERELGLVFRFVIGHTSDASLTAELEKEIDIHRDFMRIDNKEEYLRLPYKTLTYFKAAYTLYDADFYVKADDDIYLRPDRLAVLLAKSRPRSRTYVGCMKKGGVITNSAFKWYERLGYLLGNEYFYHAYGPIYALSRDVVADLSAFKNDSMRMFSNEDVTIGSWMLAFNVDHEDDRTLCQDDCQVNSIAVWDIPQCSGLCHPETKLLTLHQQDMCSKSSTLPNG